MTITPDNTKITLIGNPFAGKWAEKNINIAYNILKKKGFDTDIKFTRYRGHAEKIAREIVNINEKANYDNIVISAGGDGTYNEVANGLINSNVPMAILPMGTTSVLAIELKIPKIIEETLESIIDGAIVQINTGIIECQNNGEEIKRHFLLMAGIGFDAEAVKGMNTEFKKTVGKLAYIISGFKILLKNTQHLITANIVQENGNIETIKCSNIIIGKASHYGGYFRVTPDASLIKSYFYCFLTHGVTRLDLIKYISGIVTHRHLGFSDVEYKKAHSITLVGNAPIQIDGDYIGELPARITIGENTLKLIVKKDFVINNKNYLH